MHPHGNVFSIGGHEDLLGCFVKWGAGCALSLLCCLCSVPAAVQVQQSGPELCACLRITHRGAGTSAA